MLTDWLIWLDYLEENNYNTSFLRLITPTIFGIIKCNNCNYRHSFGNGNGKGKGYGYGIDNGNGYGYGYGVRHDNGNGHGYGYDPSGYRYLNSYNEEH